MALTPFVADTPAAPDESGSTFDNIKSQWNSFLSKPEGQAALLSFGINMLQPPSFGDNPLAQAGRALGHAGRLWAISRRWILRSRRRLEQRGFEGGAGR